MKHLSATTEFLHFIHLK